LELEVSDLDPELDLNLSQITQKIVFTIKRGYKNQLWFKKSYLSS
jgi:hypothetical protein